MKNFKINTNRESLSAADIAKGKDFNRLLEKYNAAKAPIHKTIKFWFGASALAAAIMAVVVMYNFPLNAKSGAFINPPIAAANIPTTSYQVNTASDSTISYNSGSKIHIPANAFLDAHGNKVNGKVDVHYREFKKVSEVFLSGIPMTYDSGGQQYHFETAGMMEISATQNGNSLKPNPNALITVDMVSFNKENRFNTYYLDTIERKWKYQAQANGGVSEMDGTAPPLDSASPVSEMELKKIDREISKLEVQRPIEPMKEDKYKPRFTIKVDAKEFPEIAVYKNVKFQVESKGYDPRKADTLWNNIELKRVEGSLKYQVIFSREVETGSEKYVESYKVMASPVFDDKDYAGAKKIYDEKYTEYQTKIAERKAEEARVKAEMAAKEIEAAAALKAQREEDARQRAGEIAKQKADEAALERQSEEMQARRKQYAADLRQNALVYRAFAVKNFGIWNCDCPTSLPHGEPVTASLVDAKTGQPVTIQQLFLVEKGGNIMFSYMPGTMGNFRFDRSKENMIWAITGDLKIAIIRPEQFKASKINGNEMVLQLNIIDKKFTSSEEAERFLEL